MRNPCGPPAGNQKGKPKKGRSARRDSGLEGEKAFSHSRQLQKKKKKEKLKKTTSKKKKEKAAILGCLHSHLRRVAKG